jgi:3',5'-cyclic AMP phosphodiesterase CpdA
MAQRSGSSLDRRRFLELLGASGLVLQGSIAGLSLGGCKPEGDDTGPQDELIYFAVISDTHLKADNLGSGNDEVLEQTLEILEEYEVPVDLVLVAGDLIDVLPSDDPAYYDANEGTALHEAQELLSGCSIPVHIAMGNHDYYLAGSSLENNLTDDYAAREALYQERLGMPAPWYAFEHRGIRFIALNSMQPDARVDWVPESCGSFGEEQLAWLEEQLADGTPCVLFFHHPLATDVFVESGYSFIIPFEVPRAEGNYEKYEGTVYEGWTDPIYAILEAHAEHIMGVFVGHGHAWVQDSWADIPVLEADSVGNAYPGTFIEVDGEEQPMRYHLVEINLTQGSFAIYNRAWIPYEG